MHVYLYGLCVCVHMFSSSVTEEGQQGSSHLCQGVQKIAMTAVAVDHATTFSRGVSRHHSSLHCLMRGGLANYTSNAQTCR